MSTDKDAEAEMNRQLLAFMMNSALDKLLKKKPVEPPEAKKPEDAPASPEK